MTAAYQGMGLTYFVLEQYHLGILSGWVILAADIGLNNAGMIRPKNGEEVVDASLSMSDQISETIEGNLPRPGPLERHPPQYWEQSRLWCPVTFCAQKCWYSGAANAQLAPPLYAAT